MKQERKNIKEAIDEADNKLASFLMARLTTEDYHEAVELSNVVVDLTVHAFSLAVDQNRQHLGVTVDASITPKILPKLGADDAEHH